MPKNISDYDFTTMLEEAQEKLKRQYQSMNTLREHAKLVMGSSSIIVSLFTLAKLGTTKIQPEYALHYIILVSLIAISYAILMVLSIKGALPYPLIHAIEPTWETYVNAFKDETNRTILERRVYAYLSAIKDNQDILVIQYAISKKITYCLMIVVILILAGAVLIPIFQVP